MEESKVTQIRKRGELTPRGRVVASRNAQTHGIYSETVPVLSSEDKSRYDSIYEGFISEFAPQHTSEYALCQCAAMALLRLGRIWSTESKMTELAELQAAKVQGFFDTQEDALQHLKKLRMAEDQRQELERLESGIRSSTIGSALATVDFERLGKRERHLDRLLNNAIDRLNVIKKERQQANLGHFVSSS